MSQSPSQVRVKSGIPWWLWALMAIVTGAVVLATVINMVPPNPEKDYQDGLQAWEGGKLPPLRTAISRLEGNAAYAGKLEMLKGLELMANSRPLKAVPVLEKASENPEVRIQSLSYLAQALARGDRRPEALVVLEKAVKEAPENALPRKALAGILYEIGAFERSLEEFSSLEKSENGLSADFYGLRGEMLMHMEQFSEAVVAFRAAIDADPNSASKSILIQNIANCLYRQGDFEGSLKVLDDLTPGPEKDILRAESLVGLGKLDEVRKIVDAATSQTSNSDPRMTRKMELRLAVNADKEKAGPLLAKLRESVPMFSRDADYYSALAKLAALAGQDEESKVYLENEQALLAIQAEYKEKLKETIRNQNDGAARMVLGDLAADSGSYEQARFWFSAAGKADPSLAAESEGKLNGLYYVRPELISAAQYRAKIAPVEPGHEGHQHGGPQDPLPPGAIPDGPKPGDDKLP